MPDFPFEAVYNFFAEPFVKTGLDAQEITPMLWIVQTDWVKVTEVRLAPERQTVSFFTGPEGKERLGKVIRMSLAEIGNNPFCLVLISEAYRKQVEKPTEEELEKIKKQSLENDPDAEEVILINVLRQEGTRCGALPIMPDRSVKFEPIFSNGKLAGRLTSET